MSSFDSLFFVKCITFEEAVEQGTPPQGKPTLLLGNGFSIAYDRNIFSYQALLRSVDWSKARRVGRVFGALKTVDFEIAIRNLEIAGEIAELYEWGDDKSEMLRHDANFLKEALIQAIQSTHPTHVFQVDSERIKTTARFLRNFGRLFTVNYDLLLYWAFVQSGKGLSNFFTDGFKQGDNGGLEWADFPNQGVLYLHGALHLFQDNGRLEKIKYFEGEGGRLIQQIANRISDGHAPLFVCEGSTTQKLVHIQNSRYLRFCFNMLANTQGPLFIYGLSLAEQDEHISNAITKSQVSHLFISLHGDPNSAHNQQIQARAHEMQRERSSYRALKVDFYSANTAEIW